MGHLGCAQGPAGRRPRALLGLFLGTDGEFQTTKCYYSCESAMARHSIGWYLNYLSLRASAAHSEAASSSWVSYAACAQVTLMKIHSYSEVL